MSQKMSTGPPTGKFRILPATLLVTLLILSGSGLSTFAHGALYQGERIFTLHPPLPPTNNSTPMPSNERGVYITALRDLEVTRIWVRLTTPYSPFGSGFALTVRIYEATGTTRGPLLAEASREILESGATGDFDFFIPCTLEACKDYDIAFQVSTNCLNCLCGDPLCTPGGWDWFSENTISMPFDVGSFIRVRDAEIAGNANDTSLPLMKLAGIQPTACPPTAELGPNSTPPNTTTISNTQSESRGIFVEAKQTMRLCSLGWYLKPTPGSRLNTLSSVYEASGTTRQTAIVTERATVDSTMEGWYDFPLGAVLEEGRGYNLSITAAISGGGNSLLRQLGFCRRALHTARGE